MGPPPPTQGCPAPPPCAFKTALMTAVLGQTLRLGLRRQQLLKRRIAPQPGELAVGVDLLFVRESLVQRPAQVVDGAVVHAGPHAPARDVIVHGAAIMRRTGVCNLETGAIKEDLRVKRKRRLIGLPTLLEVVLDEQDST